MLIFCAVLRLCVSRDPPERRMTWCATSLLNFRIFAYLLCSPICSKRKRIIDSAGVGSDFFSINQSVSLVVVARRRIHSNQISKIFFALFAFFDNCELDFHRLMNSYHFKASLMTLKRLPRSPRD